MDCSAIWPILLGYTVDKTVHNCGQKCSKPTFSERITSLIISGIGFLKTSHAAPVIGHAALHTLLLTAMIL